MLRHETFLRTAVSYWSLKMLTLVGGDKPSWEDGGAGELGGAHSTYPNTPLTTTKMVQCSKEPRGGRMVGRSPR